MTYERDNIAAMAGYSYGEQPEVDGVIKLNTNENPHPPSPAVQQALNATDASALRIYPSATAASLRQAIADHHGVDVAQVVCTHGGDEALRLAITTFVGEGETFGMAEPSYSLYPVLAAVQNAKVQRIELQADWALPADTAQRLNAAAARLTCIVNPHAPSGVLASTESMLALAQALGGVLLIDEAYADFIAPDEGYSSAELVNQLDNLLILRTFSKGYSLAGLRLGYLLGSANLIEPILTKTRDSYNIDAISQLLGEAALGDQAYAQQTWQQVRSDRQALLAGLAQLGFNAPPSHSNFLLVAVPDGRAETAQHLYETLKARNIYVRYFAEPRLADRLRISVGTAEQNQALIAALQDCLSAAAGAAS
ncbi:MAG: histidinol-phosphate transaminase [Pseudomonadales bacterium]